MPILRDRRDVRRDRAFQTTSNEAKLNAIRSAGRGDKLLQGWAVVMTASNMERRVLRGCEPHGLKAHLFLTLDARKRERILFCNYVMAYVNPSNWHKLFSTPGVTRVLMSGDHPALLPGDTMARLRALEDERGYVVLPERFERNQPLVVQNGIYKNQIVLYKGMNAEQRECALLTMLNCEVELEFEYSELAPVVETPLAA
jgi:transcription antitermination factor NusG